MRPITIYLDFDGTMVEHKYPSMGKEVENAVHVVKRLQNAGHKIILNTMRAYFHDGTLEQAQEWLHTKGIIVSSTTASKIHPGPFLLFNEIQIYNDPLDGMYLFLDDKANGTPLLLGAVNWERIEKLLDKEKLFNPTSNTKQSESLNP